MPLQNGPLFRALFHGLCVSLIAGAAGWFALESIQLESYLVRMIVASAAFALTLAGLATALKVPEWELLVQRLKRPKSS